MPSSRRRLLTIGASLVGGIGLGGCVGDAGSPGNDDPTDSTPGTIDETPVEKTPQGSETPTDPPGAAERAVGGSTVAVTDVVARKAVTYASVMGSGGVVVRDGSQFVVASVHADAELDAAAFSMRNGSRSWPASNPGEYGAINYAVAGHEGGSVGEGFGDGPRYVAFEVDSPLDPDEPRIHLNHGGESAEWPLPEDAASTLAAAAPTFELDSFEAPDRVEQGDTMEVTLTVTNASDGGGRFLAALYWPTELVADDDESTVVETTVDAGASATESVEIDTRYTTGEDGPVTLAVEGYVETSTEVQVTGTGTDA